MDAVEEEQQQETEAVPVIHNHDDISTDTQVLAIPFTALHAFTLMQCLITFTLCASPLLSMFDETTMRPTAEFPFRSIAIATNLPIKLGFFHMFLYMVEFIYDRAMFRRHVGARLTTLWWQLGQYHRYGQHLQMHVETQLQLVDAFLRKDLMGYRPMVVVGLITCYVIITVQNGLTSLAYHSLEEQAIGFCFALTKVVWDYRVGIKVNCKIGEALDHLLRWIGGAITLLTVSLMNGTPMYQLHPTTIGTALFMGGLFVWILVGSLRKARIGQTLVAFADRR